ncbi:hypothetical protein BFS35_013400 [Macrococcoides goetzii]|uniref:Transcriptional regulator SgrR N-terminal HTH domain-containing protein n=1 Tax=Macrococcoides goetzii TaxID=1891097 RepID=A0A2G5NU40_9STAP|nr:ABC transporter substrate-binding protein [Macrococcus goetzii]RAI78890.1 hypothetical protein BFS35_013400 [Macrococcus goetzii]
MVDVDEKLLKLYLYMQHNDFSRDAVSDFLEISPRQLSRLMNKWSEDGFILFNSGVGRGNATQIDFLKNIEAEFINHLFRNLEDYDVQQLQSIMALDMSANSKRILRLCIEEVLYSRRDFSVEQFNFIDYLYRIPERIHPLEPLDIALVTVLSNVGERLYNVKGNEVTKTLVIFDEWIGNDLIIHLQRDIHFSNGDLLFAYNVVQVLTDLIEVKADLPGLNDVLSVEVVDTFKLKISMRKKSELIKYILSQDFASIYKIKNNKILYTGPYYVHSLKPEIIMLKLNPYYSTKIPDITDVWLINDLEQYQDFVQRKDLKEEHTKLRYSMDFLTFNPNCHMTLEERKRLAHIILGEEQPEVFIDKLRMLGIKGSRDTVTKVIETLNACVKFFEYIEVTIEDYIAKPLESFDVDVVMMNEALPMHQKYFNLLLSEKFSTWIKHYKESEYLQYIYQHKSIDYWQYAEHNYEQFLIQNGLIVILDYYGKKVLTMDSFKDYEVTDFGVVKYDSIISVEEEK